MVFLTGRRANEVEDAAGRVGHGARGLLADASVPEDLLRVVKTIQEAYGRIDALVLNAGMSEPASLADVTPEHFDRHFAVNVRGAGVLIGSISAVAGIPGYGAYNATKAAVRSYARTWTAELVSQGIRVNVMAPAPTDTEMFASVPQEARAAITSAIPIGRMAR